MTDIETYADIDLDVEELSLNLDTRLATVEEDLYLVEIKNAKLQRSKNNPDNVGILVSLEIVHGPYTGVKATNWIGVDMTKTYNAKNMKNIAEAMLGEALVGDLPVTFERVEDDKGSYQRPKGWVGMTLGAYLKSDENSGNVNVTFKGYVPAFDPTTNEDAEQPF